MGREGGSTSLGVEEKQGTQRENVMWPAVRPDILLLSFFLGLSMWAGRNGDRKQPPPPPPFLPSSSPTLLQLFTHSVTHSSCLPRSTTTPFPFPLPHPTFHPSTHAASSPFSGPGFCCMNFPNCTHRPHTSRFVCLPSPTGVPVHHNSLGVEVR